MMKASDSEMEQLRGIVNNCFKYVKDQTCQLFSEAVDSRAFSISYETGYLKQARKFTYSFCTELMYTFGSQLSIIHDNKHYSEMTVSNMSNEDKAQLKAYEEAT